MKYKCVVFDHDDTLVASQKGVHYPSFIKIMKECKPGQKIPTFVEFIEGCNDPGYYVWCERDLGFTEEEKEKQNKIWMDYVNTHVPRAYEGVLEVIEEIRKQGSKIAIVTHNVKNTIIRDFYFNRLPMPDDIFSSELPPKQQKPNVWPLQHLCEKYDIDKSEIIVIDDMMTGIKMAKAFGALAVGVGWSQYSKKVEETVKNNCDIYCKSVENLKKILFV